MDKKFLEFYNQELKFIRESAAEFAAEYPKIAGRLAIDGFDCADPYVERLLEGFAFLSARIHLKLDASFPTFTQHLLELIYPGFLIPSPSVLLAQFTPDLGEGTLAQGITIPKGTLLHSSFTRDETTSCKYSLTQDVVLWPLDIISAEYVPYQTISQITTGTEFNKTAKSGISLTLQLPETITFQDLSLRKLPISLRGSEALPSILYESLLKNFCGVVFGSNGKNWVSDNGKVGIVANGFSDDESLLPKFNKQFDGIRLLREYFLFDRKFLSVSLCGLDSIFKGVNSSTIEIIILMREVENKIENRVNKDNFQLFCSPAINLFNKKAERVLISNLESSFHIVADRIRPMDYEVCFLTSVEGISSSNERTFDFLPLYSYDQFLSESSSGFYTVARERKKRNNNQVKFGHRSSYIGSEVYISLVDPRNAPYSSKLKQLIVEVMCSNRDLPLMMPLGKGITDFTIETGAPCISVRCLGEPTRPQEPLAQGSFCWDLVQQLAINFLGFASSEPESTSVLKRLLSLLLDSSDAIGKKQIDGILSVNVSKITKRLPINGPISFGRGVEVRMTVDKQAFEGGNAYVLATVLDKFFSQYVSVNSFSQFVLCSSQDGEIYRWPIRTGLQEII